MRRRNRAKTKRTRKARNNRNALSILILLAGLTAVFGITVNGSASSVIGLAGKPSDVVAWSNGFPSGDHFNLNIHGKKPGYECNATPGGGSVFVPEYGQAEIQYIQNKRSDITYLYVLDPCSFSPSDPAKVKLPSGEYQVYARILAKPGNKKTGENRSVIFYPKLIDACDDTGEAYFGNLTSCSDSAILGIGKITVNGVFDKDSQYLVRIAPVKGKNQAQDITDMFQWTGYVCDPIYDTNGDGQITLADVPTDLDGDGDIDSADLAIYLDLNCSFFEHEWIFNIADLVVYGWDYNNQGSKLVQIRFYPVTTTTFI